MHSSHQTREGVSREKPWASSPGGLSHPEKTLLNCLRLVALAQEVLFPEVMVWPPRLLLEKRILPLKAQMRAQSMGTTESRTPLTTVPLSPARHLPTEASIHKCIYTECGSLFMPLSQEQRAQGRKLGERQTPLSS